MIRVLRIANSFGFGSTVGLRVASMVCGLLLTMATTHILTAEYGITAYALFAVVVSLLATLPFADLGLGAGVVNATSDTLSGEVNKADYVANLSATFRLLAVVAASVVLVALFIGFAGWWTPLLGLSQGGVGADLASTLTFVMLGLSIPLGIGTRIYQGAAKTQVATAWTFVGTAFQAVTLLVFASTGAAPWLYVLGPAGSLLLTNLIITMAATRYMGIRLSAVLSSPPRLSAQYGLRQSALPYLIVSLGFTLTLQIQRVALAHVTLVREVAEYALVAQFAIPIMSVVTLSSINLWPRFRTAMTKGRLTRSSFVKLVGIYAGVGFVFGGVCAAASTLASKFVGAGLIQVAPATAIGAWILVFAWSATRPAVMLLNDNDGFRVQAVWALPSAVIGVGGTLLFGELLGASSAFYAPALAFVVCNFLPLTVMSLRKIGGRGGADGR